MKIAIQMDPIGSLKFETDTSLRIAAEFIKRNWEVFCYQPKNLLLTDDLQVMAFGNEIVKLDVALNEYELGDTLAKNLANVDIVLIRQDPPFDMDYITTTYILEYLPENVLIANNPSSIRNYSEKLIPKLFPSISHSSIICSDFNLAKDFINSHEKIVIKPLYGFAGGDVACFDIGDSKALDYFDLILEKSKAPVILQKFIPNIIKGDKRILLLDGEIIGALNRLPASGSIKANTAAGGSAEKTDITERDLEIGSILSSFLKEKEILLAGIDVIDGYLNEVNITSPTGVGLINKLYNVQLEEKIVDCLISKSKKSLINI